MKTFNKRGGNFDRSGGNDRGDRRGGFSPRPSFGGDRGGDRGGRPSFGHSGKRPSFGGDRGPARRVEMHAATCAQCTSACEVPFRPFPGQEVLCNNCFSKDGVNAPSKSFSRNNAPRPNPVVAEVPQVLKLELNQIHSKIDKILSIVQKMVAENTPISEEIEEIVEEVKETKKSFTPKLFRKKN